ncbi:hypothetical protein H6G04_32545 [Calothrix membranacea FACHB-236]|nr:hypothetical protein [Calothrix membranacea FACHB-236]
MANIKVNDLFNLNLSGVDLFNDSESFLTELSDDSQQMGITGGCMATTHFSICVPGTCNDGTCAMKSVFLH